MANYSNKTFDDPGQRPRRRVRIPWVIAAALSVLSLSLACGTFPFGPSPTAYPTPTPYLSFDPVALHRIPTPTPNLTPPSFDYVETDEVEFFVGAASEASLQAEGHFAAGDYRAAIDSFKEVQRLHGKPSSVVESLIGTSYQALGMYSLSIDHFSKAIGIEDSTIDRTNRSHSYVQLSRCDLAMADANAALSMKPISEVGFHTNVEAFSVLGLCHANNGDFKAAAQHLEIALALAVEHQYPADVLADLQSMLNAVQE